MSLRKDTESKLTMFKSLIVKAVKRKAVDGRLTVSGGNLRT